MRSDHEGVLLNIGHKSEGLVPPREMRTLEGESAEQLKIGDEVICFVVNGESGEGTAILSIDRAVGEIGWKTLEKAITSGELVDGKILGFNRGGAIVEAEGVAGFVPMSQLVTVSRSNVLAARESSDAAESGDKESVDGDGGKPEESPDIGKVLHLKVLEVNRSRNRAIMSERQAVHEEREARKVQLIKELSEGEVRKGKVTGISSFGAFVDLGGADGLIHISELSWSTVSSPSQVLKIGDEIDVFVLRVDAERKKIALSLKRLQQEPWETINERHEVGDLVDATITKLTDFGAFARVEGSVEGLIHISELTSRMINHPKEVVREGDTVRLKILRIEPERRRLGLSLRQAEEEGEETDPGQLGLSLTQEEEPERGRLGMSLRKAEEEQAQAALEEEAESEEEEAQEAQAELEPVEEEAESKEEQPEEEEEETESEEEQQAVEEEEEPEGQQAQAELEPVVEEAESEEEEQPEQEAAAESEEEEQAVEEEEEPEEEQAQAVEEVEEQPEQEEESEGEQTETKA